jgi:hypothetical protein
MPDPEKGFALNISVCVQVHPGTVNCKLEGEALNFCKN